MTEGKQMKIGIMSDSHDHLPNLRHALQSLESLNIHTVIHCGDLVAPFITLELGKFKGNVHTVFGNNDGDRFLSLRIAAESCPNVTHHGEGGVLHIDNHHLAFAHYEAHAMGLAEAHQCQAAFYGHTHQHAITYQGKFCVLNPGELLGLKESPSFCISHLSSGEVEYCPFDTQPWPRSAWQ
jgi:putative phosphoesterase